MPFVAILIGALVLIAAINNSFGDLAHELETDIPGYFKWGVAIAAILGLGYIPGLRTPSRWLLALVAVVIVVTQGQNIIAGLQQFASSSGTPSGTAEATPTAAYAAAATGGATTTQVAGSSSGPQVANANPLGNLGGGSAIAAGGTAAGSASSVAGAATQLAGTVAGPLGTTIASAATQLAANPFDPGSYLGAFEDTIGGLFG